MHNLIEGSRLRLETCAASYYDLQSAIPQYGFSPQLNEPGGVNKHPGFPVPKSRLVNGLHENRDGPKKLPTHTQQKSGNGSDARLFMDSSSRAPRKLSVSRISCPVRIKDEPLHKRETWPSPSVRPSYADLRHSLAGSNGRMATLRLFTAQVPRILTEYDEPLRPHLPMNSHYTRRPTFGRYR